MTTELNFMNESNDNTANVVIFQKNVASKLDEIAVAWRVFSNARPGDRFPFTFSPELELAASDSFADLTPPVAAKPGQMFHLWRTPSGNELSYLNHAISRTKIQFKNDLSSGSVNANIYRGGNLLATKTGIAPGQKATFRFTQTIWIGVVSEIQAGQIMNSAIISQINTELSLAGIEAATIVMTGGGPGKTATPFKFTLESVRKAGTWAISL